MLDRIEQLRIFSCVARLNSFTAAAQQLNLPRSTVTFAVQQLESFYSVRLLQRTTRRVTLTQDGLNLLPLCQNLLTDFDYLEQQAQQSTQLYRGVIRVDMPNRIAHHLVIPALPDFYRQYPDIHIQLHSSDQFSDLLEQSIDCAVRVGRLQDSSLIARQLGNLHMVNCASPAYLQRMGIPASLEDLNRHYVVNYAGAVGERQAIFEYGQQHVMLDSKISVNNTEAYVAAAKAGLGIIQVPHFDVLDELALGSLKTVMAQHTAPAMPIHILYQNREYLPSRISVFIDWLTTLFRLPDNSISS